MEVLFGLLGFALGWGGCLLAYSWDKAGNYQRNPEPWKPDGR